MRHRAWWAAALVLTLASGCDTRTPEAQAPPPSQAAAVRTGNFNGTDLAWIQLMLPMTEQLIPMLALGAERAQAAPLRDLAGRLRDQHRTEAGELRALLTRTGLPDENPHEGHNMPGMVTPDEVTALAQAQGPAFDEGLATALREYLAQVAMVSGSESKVGTDTDTLALATRIAADRTKDLAELESAV
ncbi:DUF305 domain-containing protein [Catenuloplanes japonicus]|uniref:DUF305 domain-containing protein n=1 Tax=Catenuloplanes japonicus TaxID=33876 RepID=UPI0012F8E697|nr:DUF305 domain-containing protein [Catenuloplanes japonicus]